MKILKRTKGVLRFRTPSGGVTLKSGENELSDEESKLVKSHPMFEAMVKTSGLVEVAEPAVRTRKKRTVVKDEKDSLIFKDDDLADDNEKTLEKSAKLLTKNKK